jgi:IPTL-CTERM motif
MNNARSASTIGVATWAISCGLVCLVMTHPGFALAAPTLTGQASTPALVGGSLTDTATLAGGANPTGSITFSLFAGAYGAGRNSSGCQGAAIFTSTTTVTGNGSYTSGAFSPLASEIYSWTASYSGDPNNSPVATGCLDFGGSETVFVPQYCAPQPCPAATATCGSLGNGAVNTAVNTVSESEEACTGTSASTTVNTITMIGPDTVCYGANRTESCSIVAGGQDINTNVEVVSVNTVAVPTLSIWGFVALAVVLGALTLRRLRVRADS